MSPRKTTQSTGRKVCTSCHTEKDAGEFHRDGLYVAPHCKLCRAQLGKLRYAARKAFRAEQSARNAELAQPA